MSIENDNHLTVEIIDVTYDKDGKSYVGFEIGGYLVLYNHAPFSEVIDKFWTFFEKGDEGNPAMKIPMKDNNDLNKFHKRFTVYEAVTFTLPNHTIQ